MLHNLYSRINLILILRIITTILIRIAIYTRQLFTENTFTVVVEKDGRGLGMSVCGGGGLVRIRRLYPPQPAWRTGRLAQRDLLLSANNVPLAGLSTYVSINIVLQFYR